MMSMLDLADLLQERLPAAMRAALRRAAALATARHLPLYLVGGVVRDLLLERPLRDADLTVVGDAVGLAAALAEDLRGQVLIHRRFGTARVTWDDLSLDLVTARAERYPRPGALPVVRAGDLRDDLLRRDFTIHALAVRLDGASWGQLLDQTGGLDDLRQGLVRVLHPRSFQDDPTRLFRAVRYEQRLGFRLAPDTEALLRQDVGFVTAVSADRLRREVVLILEEDQPERALARAQELGLLQALLPTLCLTEATANAFAAARDLLAPQRPSAGLCLCLLAYAAGPDQRAALAARLRLPRDQAAALADLNQVQAALPTLEAPASLPSAVASLLDGCSDAALLAVALRSSDLARQRIACYREIWRAVRPSLSGRDLQGLGVPKGPLVGGTLARLRAARLDERVRTRDDEVRLVRVWLPSLVRAQDQPPGAP